MPTAVLAPDRTRSRILGVAVELIAEKGFAATSTREVCERMGFTKAALWYHFKAKDDLLVALLEPVLDALQDLVDGAPVHSPAAARRAALVAYVDLLLAHREVMRVAYDDPSVRSHPAMTRMTPLYRRLLHLLAGTSSPDLAALSRSRGALGAAHAVLLRADPGDDRDVLRETALVSACGALGVPAPRRS